MAPSDSPFGKKPRMTVHELSMVMTHCQRQKDFTQEAIINLAEAYLVARSNWKVRIYDLLPGLATFVCPSSKYRTVPVHFADPTYKALSPDVVPYAMESFLQAFQQKTFPHRVYMYTEFEKIHPFTDGNGRIGWLLCMIYEAKAAHKWELLDTPLIDWSQA